MATKPDLTVGKRAPDSSMAGTLALALVQSGNDEIDFTIDGVRVTGAVLSEVADALISGKIQVYFWKNEATSIAMYDAIKNRFVVSKNFGKFKLQEGSDFGLAVHESVHAAFDLHPPKSLQKLVDEACAYVTQMLHARIQYKRASQDTNPITAAADKVAAYILGHKGAPIPKDLLDDLKNKIKADELYKNDWTVKMDYNGILDNPPPMPGRHQKPSHHSQSIQHAAVSPSHANSFRTPGVFGVNDDRKV